MGIIPMLNDLASSYSGSQSIGWIKTPYGLRLADDPNSVILSLLEQEEFAMEVDGENSKYVDGWLKVLTDTNANKGQFNRNGISTEGPPISDIQALLGSKGDLFYSSPNYTDTRVGGNDAINPYWQFNIDDDIVPPMLKIPGLEFGGMGRVYSETYDANQQILWLSMGVPEYTNLISFYMDAGDNNAARLMNKGTLRGLVGTIINYAFKAVIWAFTFPVMAPFWVAKWINRIVSDRVTQYFYFRPTMVIYYELVNTMLSYLAVGLGLYPQVFHRRADSTKILGSKDSKETVSPGDIAKYYQPGGESVTDEGTAVVDDARLTAAEKQAKDAAAGVNVKVNKQEITNKSANAPNERQRQNMSSDTARTNSGYGGDLNDGVQVEFNEALGPLYADTQSLDGMHYPPEGNADPYTQTLIKAAAQNKTSDTGIPEILQYGPDIFSIINRRARLFKAERVAITTRQLLALTQREDQSVGNNFFSVPQDVYVRDAKGNVFPQEDESKDDQAKKSGWTKLYDSFKANMFGAGDFVGFRIEKGVSCNENILNATGQLGIAQKLNSFSAEQRQKYENYGGSWIAKTVGELAKDPKTMLSGLATEVLAKAASSFGMGDIGTILTNGNGFVDIPEVWQSSSFDRSFSFNINLYARYGDPVSIFQSIYIPMCMLLCAAMPRSVGNAMYTSPFLIKAFCKGFFSIPCGLITSLSFTRGADEFGWSCNMLPTRVGVSMTIKDLSPTFFMSMQDIGILDTFSRNDKLMEYLDTLSALGIYERMYAYPKAIRKLSAALLIKKNTIFNSDYWGMRLGKSALPKALARVIPYKTHEKSDARYNAG